MAQDEPSKPARDERGRLLKGHSANPSGVSKEIKHVRDLCRQLTPEALIALREALNNQKTKVAAASVILAYGWGKPAQPHTDASGEGPMKLEVTWLNPVAPAVKVIDVTPTKTIEDKSDGKQSD